MEEFDSLLEGVKNTVAKVKEIFAANKNIIILGHLDADGISSSSILAKTFQRQGYRFTIRILNEMTPQVLKEIAEENYDYYILCELGGGLAKEIDNHLGDKWILIDHHQIPDEELNHERVFNVWRYGIDGSNAITTTGIAYLIATVISDENVDLSWMPVVAALADRQDQGEGKSMMSINQTILNESVTQGFVKVSKDLAFYGRETRPIHVAMASTTNPFLVGLTGNGDACLATLKSIGIEVKDGDRWRTVSELSDEEKKKLVEAIIPHVTDQQHAEESLDELIAPVYVLTKEDEFSQLRDARELGTLLNACGRTGRSSVAIALCLGERGKYLSEAVNVLSDYRQTLSKCIKSFENEERLTDKRSFVIASGDDIVDEDMVGAVASVLSSTPKFRGKMLVLHAPSKDGGTKVSARRPPEMTEINLGDLLKKLAIKCKGVGGGHSAAAGAKIPAGNIENFLKLLVGEMTIQVDDKNKAGSRQRR